MVKQMDRDSTKEKIKDMDRIGKLIFDSPLCSVTCYKIGMSTKITLEIILSFLVLPIHQNLAILCTNYISGTFPLRLRTHI